jgi:PAS domain S-box-containing protein
VFVLKVKLRFDVQVFSLFQRKSMGVKLRFFTMASLFVSNLAGRIRGKSIQTGWRMMINDIDKHKQTKEALKCCEEKYRSLVEQSLDMFFLCDLKGNLSYVNQAVVEKTGYSEEELLSSNIFHFFPEQFDHDKTLYQWKNWAVGQKIKLESQITSKKGTVYPVEINISKLSVGQRRYILALVRDVTEQKQTQNALIESEDRFRIFLERLPGGIFAHDINGRILFCNKTACKNTGYSKEELLAMSVKDIDPDSIDRDDRTRFWHSLHMGESATVESTHIRKDGSPYPAEIHISAVKLQGEPVFLPIAFDITERKRAEAATEEAHQRLLTVLDGINAMIYLSDMESHEILFVNQYVRDKFGDVVGKKCRSVFKSEQIEFCDFCTTQNLLDARGNPKGIYRREFQNAKTGRWYDSQARAIKWIDGRLVRLEIGIDITDRKQAEVQLRESEIRNRTMLKSIPDLIFINSREGIFLDYHAYDQKLLLAEPEQFLGKSIKEVLPDIVANQILHCFEAVHETKQVQTLAYDLDVRGVTKWFEAWITPMDDQRQLTVVRDITDRKYAEEALRQEYSFRDTIIDKVAEGLCVCHPIAEYPFVKFTVWNDRMTEITGYTLDEINRLGWYQTLYPDFEVQKKAVERMKKMREGEDIISEEWEITDSKGNKRILNISSSIIKSFKGVVNVLALMQDITQRKRSEEALKQLKETLEQQVAERTALAEDRAKQLQSLAVELIEAEERERQRIADLLHDDLQQMLAAAKMQLQAVSDELSSEPAITGIENILAETIVKSRHLSHELSPPVLHHFGIVAALQWLGDRMYEQFNLVVEFETDTEPQLEYPPLRTFLFRAVQELLYNIVKHAGVKKAHIMVSKSNTNITISVSDYGKGFNPAILNDPIQKIGFGLISIRERASYIGGRFTIESAPDKGSSFTLTIPLILSKDDESSPQLPVVDLKRQISEEPEVFASGKIRVLFADDHDVMRQGLITLVSGQSDIQVVGEAANGQEAVDQARDLRPDVVVMDVSMPEMNGAEATRRIKSELPYIRVIALSMYEEEQVVRTMIKAGAESFVSKSASSAELMKAIYGIKHEKK